MQYFGKVHWSSCEGWLTHLGQCKAKLRRSSTNGRASPLSAAASSAVLHCWLGTPTLSYTGSFQTGPACILCSAVFPPGSLHLGFVPFVGGSSALKFPTTCGTSWRAKFFGNPTVGSLAVDIKTKLLSKDLVSKLYFLRLFQHNSQSIWDLQG